MEQVYTGHWIAACVRTLVIVDSVGRACGRVSRVQRFVNGRTMDQCEIRKSYTGPDLCNKGDVIKHRWEVLEKLGAGTFGQVYKVLDKKTGLYWALKVETNKAKKPVLRMDVAIAKAMIGRKHSAAFFACGHEASFSYMVTQLLGRNLASRKRSNPDRRFPLNTTVRIGIQVLQALRDMHECGYLHRDIKPSNLATGVGEYEKVIYLLDFGLARNYLDNKGRIYPPRPQANFRGTIRYASPRAHQNKELSRGDDLWSLLYSLVDLYVGRLPWHSLREMKRVGDAKMLMTFDELCRGFPPTWRQYYNVCKNLPYDAVPEYDFLIRAVNGVSNEKPTGIIDLKKLTTAHWDWDAASVDHDTSETDM